MTGVVWSECLIIIGMVGTLNNIINVVEALTNDLSGIEQNRNFIPT